MCDGEDRTTSLELLLEVVDEFVALPAGERSPYEIGDHLIRLRHGIDLLELRFARDAAEFAATEEAVAQGSTSPIDWVRHQCGMSANAAARSIATGEVAEQLPASVAALEAGQIGFAHLTLVAGTARAMQGTAGATGFDERPLLGLATEHSVSRFAFDCTHARHRADAAGVLAEQVNAVEYRRLELTGARTVGSWCAGFSIRSAEPRSGSRWHRSAPARAPAMSGPGRAAWRMGWSSSPCTPSTMGSPPTGAARAPTFNSPRRSTR